MDSSPTTPEKAEAKSIVMKRQKPDKRTPCGYAAGGLRASDGTRYEVLPTGQIVRRDGGKMSKAERKRRKKARRNERDHRLENNKVHRLEACATGVGKP